MIGGAAHMAQISMQILRRMFPARLISCAMLTSHVPTPLFMQYQTIPLGLYQKQVIWDTSC